MPLFKLADPFFKVEVVSCTPNPQQTVYGAMHQDYSFAYVLDNRTKWPSEEECGSIIVRRLLEGDRGHYGCLEHPSITLNCGYFPHSTMQQLRTHRIASFDVQSFRYTSEGILNVAEGLTPPEQVFYTRPPGEYLDRQGKKYIYTEADRDLDLAQFKEAAKIYALKLKRGVSEEHARGSLPFDIRQHFVLSVNARSLMHFLDLRWKRDAQLECQQFCDILFLRFSEWMPSVAGWYEKSRKRKGKLAP